MYSNTYTHVTHFDSVTYHQASNVSAPNHNAWIFSSRLAAVFAQFIEARCRKCRCSWSSADLLSTKRFEILGYLNISEVWEYLKLGHRYYIYRQTSNIRRTWVGNIIVDHSDVVGASPVGAAPTTSSFSTQHMASMDWPKATARRDGNHLSFHIWCVLY